MRSNGIAGISAASVGRERSRLAAVACIGRSWFFARSQKPSARARGALTAEVEPTAECDQRTRCPLPVRGVLWRAPICESCHNLRSRRRCLFQTRLHNVVLSSRRHRPGVVNRLAHSRTQVVESLLGMVFPCMTRSINPSSGAMLPRFRRMSSRVVVA
jgi:hypothetical protein